VDDMDRRRFFQLLAGAGAGAALAGYRNRNFLAPVGGWNQDKRQEKRQEKRQQPDSHPQHPQHLYYYYVITGGGSVPVGSTGGWRPYAL
jgi:hypothetical protein